MLHCMLGVPVMLEHNLKTNQLLRKCEPLRGKNSLMDIGFHDDIDRQSLRNEIIQFATKENGIQGHRG